MKKRTRSILEELNNLNRSRNSDFLIENTANNIIESSINLLVKIYENYDGDVALELERRFFSSIKNADPKKFQRSIKKIKESKNNE